MKNLSKIISLTLIFILLLSTVLLASCSKPMVDLSGESDNESELNISGSGYIIKTEIKDGCIWVTYSNNPDTPVNIGPLSDDSLNSLDNTLLFHPLSTGAYGVTIGTGKHLEEIVIPAEYNGTPVTEILEDGFSGCKNLKKITIPNTIKNIGDNAFAGCGELEYNKHDNALYLGNEENPYLILVKAVNTTITRCTVNENAFAICDNAFAGCKNLTTIDIKNVKVIGSYAFKNCSSLTDDIVIPEGSSHIGPETFFGCTKIKKVTIPASVTNIGYKAFANCTSLETVNIAKNSELTGFANAVFHQCKALKKITIPKGVKYIGDEQANELTHGVFSRCEALAEVTFEEGSQLDKIGGFAFYSCKSLTKITLPDTLITLGQSAFKDSDKLESIKIPNNITNIPSEAFFACKALTTVTFGTNLIKISANAFNTCDSLESIALPKSLATIEKKAFYTKNAVLTSVTMDESNLNGWYVIEEDGTPKSLSNADLGDPAKMAKILTTDHYECDISR